MSDTILRCPVDKRTLVATDTVLQCDGCGRKFQMIDGTPDLAYSTLPDVDGHTPYIWSDVFYLENLLRHVVRPGATVVEVCSGANIVVPLLLARTGVPVTYYSIGTDVEHLRQQREGVRYPIRSVRGDATDLPLESASVDVYIGHHAINDIWLSKGAVGVARAYDEMHRVVKRDGFIVQSDCLLQHDSRVGDPSTKMTNLGGLTAYLDQHGYRWTQANGGELDWVVASVDAPVDIAPPADFVLPPTTVPA
jgi:SAM-dependent methyltransferase